MIDVDVAANFSWTMPSQATLASLPPEIKLEIISQLFPSPEESSFPSALQANANSLWYSKSFFLPSSPSPSPLTQLSQTSQEWYQLCRNVIWERLDLKGVSLQGLLGFVSLLSRQPSPRKKDSDIGKFIKAIQIPSSISHRIPSDPTSFARRLAALDGRPPVYFPRSSGNTLHGSLRMEQEEWSRTSYERLFLLLLSPSLTPSLNEISFPKNPWDASRLSLVKFPHLLSILHNSLKVLSVDFRSADADCTTVTQNLQYCTALDELSLSGESIDKGPLSFLFTAINLLPNLSSLTLSNQHLTKLCLESRTKLGSSRMRHVGLVYLTIIIIHNLVLP